eukprot:m.1022 g.1022  ORF g.1022 m.1022 type:complete len:52 (+) comp567_c0_seq1:590-745(+)
MAGSFRSLSNRLDLTLEQEHQLSYEHDERLDTKENRSGKETPCTCDGQTLV